MAETTTSLPRVRTYARDLDNERAKRGIAAPTGSAVPTPATGVVSTVPAAHTSAIHEESVPEPVEHIVAAAPAPTTVSDAVLETRRDDMKKAAEALPTNIPSFHELKKSSVRTPAKPKKITPDMRGDEIITIENDQSGATIITDTYSDRFKVAPSIFSSLQTWWKNHQKMRKQRKAPKYVVPETERRKGIIQRATSHTGKVATSDQASLRDQILARSAAPAPTADEPTTTWTPNTETVWPLLEAPEDEMVPQITNVQVTPRLRTVAAPAPVVPPAPVIEFVPPPIPVTAPIVTPPPTEVAPEVPGPSAWPPAFADTTTEASIPEPEVEKEPAQTEPEVETPRVSDRRLNTNLLSLSVVGTIVIVVAAVVGLRAYLSVPPPAPAPVYSGIVLATPTILSPLPTIDHVTIMNALSVASDTKALPATEFFFKNDDGAVAAPLILTALNSGIDQSLAQGARTIVFGWYEKTRPFIIIKITDRASSWGGMLKWEVALPSTLSPYFTFPENINSAFIDRRIMQYDVRLLTDKTGNEHLAYGFIDDSTLIITTDHPTFLLLAALATTEN
jgi:hypothetical protein